MRLPKKAMMAFIARRLAFPGTRMPAIPAMREDGFMSPVSRGFHRRRQEPAENAGRVPPGQYVTKDFPVLSAGPTPHTPLDGWSFSIGRPGRQKTWSWAEFRDLPSEDVTVDIHCVTKWTKFDTAWQGVSVDTLLDLAGHDGPFAMAHCDGGYTTNLPVEDLTGGKAWVAYAYDGRPLEPEHGGPARLLVPHLYFWKSAKWVRSLEFMDTDDPGFWENYGYHIYGDPWREQRYAGD
jgi:DMSO/TMAO reductase YedYZ molybdopterin-dependent catalytic subunit